MLARLRLLLLCALVLAPLPARAAVAAGRPDSAAPVDSAAIERPEPTIEAHPGALDDAARAAERAGPLTTLAPVLATDGALPRATVGIPAPAACAAGWSDVVQCRRWSGADVLGWATPPPARP